jgi:hypothetical protein
MAGNNKTYLALHVKRSIFFQVLTKFGISRQIPLKSAISELTLVVQWEPRWHTQTDWLTAWYHFIGALLWRFDVDSSNRICHGWGDYSPAFNREGLSSIPCEVVGLKRHWEGLSVYCFGFLLSVLYTNAVYLSQYSSYHIDKQVEPGTDLKQSSALSDIRRKGKEKYSQIYFNSNLQMHTVLLKLQ